MWNTCASPNRLERLAWTSQGNNVLPKRIPVTNWLDYLTRVTGYRRTLAPVGTKTEEYFLLWLLWFAFNFSSFYLWYQLTKIQAGVQGSCDLLSISVLSIFDTNPCAIDTSSLMLWFAFNFSSFYLWYQLLPLLHQSYVCCDLLSISVLSIFDTNFIGLRKFDKLLWFAFNFSSFYLWYQRTLCRQCNASSCDLLSISVLSIFDTNVGLPGDTIDIVVICFQFQFFLSLIPTNDDVAMASWSCDLLSISVLSIFDTNTFSNKSYTDLVVICFQFQFFLSLIPTQATTLNQQGLLWFAFNFSSFYLWYQHIQQ